MSKTKKNKQETKHSSLIIRWVSIVAATIAVSFIVFSVVVYNLVSSEALTQQKEASNNVVVSFEQRLNRIPSELQIANVMPALSPSTQKVLQGEPVLGEDNSPHNAFNDDLLSSIANPDITVTIYNLNNEIVFNKGDDTPHVPKLSSEFAVKRIRHHGRSVLMTMKKIHSVRKNKLTGYIVVTNQMQDYNNLMQNLLKWMIIVSLVAIIFFVGVAYMIVRNIVTPIKEMSQVAREVNQDPNSTARIRDFHRNDELQELGVSFNQMLDRMQRYIDQQKEFVGDVSHELRTPIAVIEGHLNMLKRWGKDDPEVLSEAISASLQESKRMQHLIQEMLDLTRAEQINVQYPNAITQVSEVLQRVVNDLALVHQDFKIQLDMDDLPPKTMIQIYQGHLEQLLVILIDNGIKYSTDRKQLNVSAGLMQEQVQIIVQDFGEGISESEQDKIFNRFYRVDKARTREKGGNGLGLAIAQKLVTSYHGNIGVDSVEGQGSQFKVTFPVLSEEKAAELRQRAEQE